MMRYLVILFLLINFSSVTFAATKAQNDIYKITQSAIELPINKKKNHDLFNKKYSKQDTWSISTDGLFNVISDKMTDEFSETKHPQKDHPVKLNLTIFLK